MMKAVKLIKIFLLSAFVFSVNTGIANAQLITGGMGITGNYAADATTLTLTSATSTGGSGDLGDYVTFGVTAGTIFNGIISYTSDPFVLQENVLQIGGWQLDLATLIIDPNSTTEKLKLGGTGWLSGNGFEATSAIWTFSAQDAASYSMTITAVPVPATVWLFGSGLLGLVGVARRKAKA